MKKSTARIIVVAVSFLIVLNLLLIGMLWMDKGKARKRTIRPVAEINAFMIRELGFDNQQAKVFTELSNRHHQVQRQNQEEFRRIKYELNSKLLDGQEGEIDSLIIKLGNVAEVKERELYRFFSEVIKMCDEEQQEKLQRVFFEATGPPPHARMPFERDARGPRPPR